VDLLLLDVQLPGSGGNGFALLRALREQGLPLPWVIFITAYDQYALQAFEVHASDYLLKPFSQRRFREALERAKAQLQSARLDETLKRLQALLNAQGPTQAQPARRLLVKSSGRITFLPVDEIDYIEAEGKYAVVHAKGQTHRLRESLRSLEQRLDARFVRVHKSTIVNVERIQELHPWFHGDGVIVLEDGTELRLSRRYKPLLEERLGGRLSL
jgi:two-component system LytT family response regulator